MNKSTSNPKVRTTFTINKADWDTFIDLISRLKLRRDNFLNDGLREEVEELKKIEPNTAKGEAYLKKERGRDAWDFPDVEFTKANLSLEKSLLEEINRVCAEKKVPRDIFLEEYIEFLVRGAQNGEGASPLHEAVRLIESPRADYSYNGENTWYDTLSISDQEVEKRERERDQEMLVAEAVAILKGIDLPTAIKSLEILSPDDQQKIRQHPKILRKVEELKRQRRSPKIVPLDGLMDSI